MSELGELVDNPNETMAAEYKDWLNLKDPVCRAKLARHIAALSNHGGGHIVFGFRDDLTPSSENPFDARDYNRDGFAAISKRYLDPAPECTVSTVTSRLGNHHVILLVPPHGATPVCIKANGPEQNGRYVGVSIGTYYIRKIGPESAPILSSTEWQPLIRRCAMHDRNAVFAAIAGVISPQLPIASGLDLVRWHNAARVAYQKSARQIRPSDRLPENSVQLSYRIVTSDNERLPLDKLIDIARQVNFEMRDRVNTGWSIFFPFDRIPINPHVTSDPSLEDEEQFLEANLLVDAHMTDSTDFWRLAPDGRATSIRAYRWDFWERDGWASRKHFSPNIATREVGEIVRHASAFAERFSSAVSVEFRCEWTGIKGRSLDDPNHDWRAGSTSRSESVVSKGSWGISELRTDWEEVVAQLASPVLRVFTTSWSATAAWVREEAKDWRPIGNHYP